MPWYYYVTITTKNRISYFGEIKDDQMILNNLGKQVEIEWIKSKESRSNIELDYFVVMPNHFHAIIILNNLDVETCLGKSLQKPNNENKVREFSKPIKNSLSIIINHFKGSVKRWANKNDHSDFLWQPRFYDRIIRNEKELFNIREYIKDNPIRWELDNKQSENIFDFQLIKWIH